MLLVIRVCWFKAYWN